MFCFLYIGYGEGVLFEIAYLRCMFRFQYYTFPQFQKDFVAFSTAYQLVSLVYGQPKKFVLQDLRNDGRRICRFCGKSVEETCFRNEAHPIPAFLGNRYVVSENECDTCNSVFGTYETHFSSYLGLVNTITRTKGRKNKVPEFRDAGGKFTAKTVQTLGMEGVMLTDLTPTGFDINMETGEAVIPYRKPGYVPVKAFKCLLKMAMSLMPSTYLVDYRELLEVLLTDAHDAKLTSLSHVMEFWLPVAAREPRVLLFQKRELQERQFSHVFQLYFHHMLFQFAVPLNKSDLWMYNQELKCQLLCPPLFHYPIEGNPLTAKFKDLSGMEKISEKDALFFSMDPAYLKELVSYNPVTGMHKRASFKPEEIVEILFVDKNQQIELVKGGGL